MGVVHEMNISITQETPFHWLVWSVSFYYVLSTLYNVHCTLYFVLFVCVCDSNQLKSNLINRIII